MPRTTVQKVRDIFDTSISDNSVTGWMDIATEFVDDIEDADSSIPTKRLAKIEKLVTAHLASSQDQRASSQSGASRSIEFQGRTGYDFRGTKHGQAAIALDPTGVLLEASIKRDSDRHIASTGG